jgi:hypothetical protein
VKASDLPLSILIVGVGGADFKEMEVSFFTSRPLCSGNIPLYKPQLFYGCLQLSEVQLLPRF